MCRAPLKLSAISKICTSGTSSQPRHPSQREAEKGHFQVSILDQQHATPLYHKLFDDFTEHEIADQEAKCELDYGLQVVPRR